MSSSYLSRSQTAGGAKDLALTPAMSARCPAKVAFPWPAPAYSPSALEDDELADDVSCVRRIFLETAQLSGTS